MVIFIEHRYYGESLPFGKDSFKDHEHLAYLTSEQALADFSALISVVKVTVVPLSCMHVLCYEYSPHCILQATVYNTDVPVVALGGSYGGLLTNVKDCSFSNCSNVCTGMLSAWLRMKYPGAVVG